MTKIDKKRIMIFAAHYPPMPGGVATSMNVIANALADEGNEVAVVTFDYNVKRSAEKFSKINLFELPLNKKTPGYKRYPFPLIDGRFKSVIREMEAFQPDMVIAATRFHLSTHVAAYFTKKNKIPLCVMECGAAPLTAGNKFIDFFVSVIDSTLTQVIRNRVDIWAAASQAGLTYLKDRFKIQEGFVWPNSIVIPDLFKKDATNTEIIITYSGRIENYKGEEELASSFMELVGKYPNIRLNFLGDGSYLPHLKDTYKHKNLKYWGNVSPETVYEVNKKTDIAVCATRFPEGAISNSVLEAGIAKCAMITSPNGAFTELIVDGYNGLLTDPNITNMREKLETLITDSELRQKLADQLYMDIELKHTPEAVAKKIIKDLFN